MILSIELEVIWNIIIIYKDVIGCEVKMRFIGSKKNLLEKIDGILEPHLDGTEKTFVDLFAGSNIVGDYFSDRFKIISNDIMYFSYILSRGTLGISKVPKFKKLKLRDISDPLQYLSSYPLDNTYKGDFVTEEYSPAGKPQRMYFTTENAKRIDFCRNTIEKWHIDHLITSDEYYYLLSSLIAAIPFVSNITGTYGAYLKKWDKRAFKELTLESPIISNKYQNESHNEDSITLIKKLKGSDIVYVDTPYNTRQYPSNYHVLETVARWNKPQLKGVTGQPNLDYEKSDFAVKRKAAEAMKTLLSNINAKHVVVSYSTDGIISEQDLLQIIKKFSKEGKVEIKRFEYRKYKSKVHNNKKLQELLFYYQPKAYINYQEISLFDIKPIKKPKKKESPKGFIKSPLNYVGGKYRLLPQIVPYFPKHIHVFLDMFSGGANVGINVEAEKVIFNDINSKINELFRYIQANSLDDILDKIYGYIDKYHLSKTNEAGFKKFRHDYNKSPNPIALYTLVSYSFNYQFRFNNKMQYNNPFGRNRSHFSKRMESNLINFSNRLDDIDAKFTDHYFTKINMNTLGKDDFVYADPPYLITTGSYNDGNRGFVNWTDKQDKELRNVLDSLDHRDIRFALSNVLRHKGEENIPLIKWSQKYNVHHLNYSYSNSSHNTTHKGSDEVLITNY